MCRCGRCAAARAAQQQHKKDGLKFIFPGAFLRLGLPADVPGTVSVVSEPFREVSYQWRIREEGEKGEGDSSRRNGGGRVLVLRLKCPKSQIGWAGLGSLGGLRLVHTNPVTALIQCLFPPPQPLTPVLI